MTLRETAYVAGITAALIAAAALLCAMTAAERLCDRLGFKFEV